MVRRRDPAPRASALCAAIGLSVTLGCASAPPPAAPRADATVDAPRSPLEATARALALDLMGRRYDAARALFDDDLKQKLPAEKLGPVIDKVVATHGAFVSVDGSWSARELQGETVRVGMRFARGRQALRVVFDAQQRVAGLWYEPMPDDLDAGVRASIAALARADWAGAEAAFDASLQEAMPPSDFERSWAKLVQSLGAFQGIDTVAPSRAGAYWLVVANCRFAGGRMGVRYTFDWQGRVVGWYVVDPHEADKVWAAPSYAEASLLEERKVAVGKSPALPGVLTLPKGGARAPVVVFVHGSGPGDMDESSSANRANRPFKDFAWGLAARGVASIRYDKRTKVAPKGVETVEQEYVEAVRAAVALAAETPEVDPKRVVLVAHSQGAALAPRIAKEVPGISAIVLLAGPTRPLQDSLVMQLEYFKKLHPAEAGLDAEIAKARAIKAAVEDPKLAPDARFDAVGVTGAYFLDLRGYDPPAVAATLAMPILVLQGERDYQVTLDDFARWRRALGSKKAAVLKTYPALNHLFMPGEGAPSPDEYDKTNHVLQEVVDDIAAFVLDPRPRRP